VDDPNSMIVDEFFLQQGGGPSPVAVVPGDKVTVADPVTGKKVTRTVVGVTSADVAFAGTYMSKGSLESILGSRVTPSRFYLSTNVSTAASSDLSSRLQGKFFRNGVKADTFLSLVEQQASASLSFLRLMQGYLALGLVVGIAGLGVVMVRAVRDRTREIGVLRSLGFLPSQVRRSFLVESGFVALEGIIIGAVLSLVTAAQLVAHGDFGKGIEFTIPWVNIIILLVTALAASLLATAWPAQRASKIAPAAALRVSE
jgi:putative ABC transport system permease protein